VLGSVYKALVEKHGAEAIPTLGATVKTTVDIGLQELARAALERGLENLDQRQGYRAATGHLEGAALDQYRYELRIARDGPKPEDYADEAAPAKPNAAAKARRLKRPLRHGLQRLTDASIFEGVVDRVERGDKRNVIVVDIGGKQGVVDLGREARYVRGPKPFVDRLKPGDLLRVRLAPERRRIGAPADDELPLALELGPQAAMVVLDPRSRDVLAVVGGYDFHAGGLNRAQRALRQPGSSFKPFVYAAAIESGRYTAASLVNDAPEVYELWKPQNYEREAFRGPVTLRTALAHSINTVSIRLVADVGVPAVIDVATRAGITTPIDPEVGFSLALGANSVTPLELANAYATLAAGGQRAPYHLVTTVDGQAIETPVPPVPGLKRETAYIVTSLMRSVVEEGTAHAAVAAAKLQRPLAGKTGTSTAMRDAWFVGFSPDLLAAVWVGFDDNRSLGRGEAGGRTAVPIWAEFMAKALANRPVEDFAAPPGITVARIDPGTGMLAAPGAEGIEEVFLEGTAPRATSAPEDDAASADRLLLQKTPGAEP
jgi:penicillin-binding protein 1A